MNVGQWPVVKYPPGMGSAPVESRLRALLLPPPMEGLKIGVLGTTVALTVAAREKKSRTGSGGHGQAFKSIQALSVLSEPQGIFPLLPYPTHCHPRGSRPEQLSRPCRAIVPLTWPGHQLCSL